MKIKAIAENRYKYYTYKVTWSEEDKEYVGLCAEFPSLSWLADSQEAAFKGICNLVAEVISDMQANNESIPEPLSVKQYKGVFTVRVTPDIHRRIAIQAAEANISMNRLVSAKLAD
jgi:predicted HicB family RNase H-like nuclease